MDGARFRKCAPADRIYRWPFNKPSPDGSGDCGAESERESESDTGGKPNQHAYGKPRQPAAGELDRIRRSIARRFQNRLW